jgi:hypothetical protein
MTYESRVMKRVVSARDRVNLLQQRVLHERKVGRGELVGELEAIKNELTRTLLEPLSDDDVEARRINLVTADHQPHEESP